MKHKILSLTDRIEGYASLKNYYEENDNISRLNEYKNMIRKIISNELTERQRDCITLRFHKNKNVKEISNILCIKEATVYKHIRNGIKKIKKHLNIYFNVYFEP